jgi:ubiquinone/menaquinone biosynthesis C-methylase UbiE
VTQLVYDSTAAGGYERAFAHVSSRFIPLLLAASGLARGHHVLDVACGTGLAEKAFNGPE